MNTKMTTLMLGVAAMLMASCSSDDALQATHNESDLKEVTITASLPQGMTTRATAPDDEVAEYCYLEIRNADGSVLDGTENTVREMTKQPDGSFQLTVKLNAEDEYNFLCWADNKTGEAPASLENVAYDTTDGKHIAFAANENHSWSNTGVAITLKHVVTRVSVKTTSFTEIDENRTLTITVPTSYTAYNVLEMAPVATTAKKDETYTNCFVTTDVVGLDPVQMGFFYVLCDNQDEQAQTDATLQNLTLRYNGYLHNDPITLSNVPMRPNYHIAIVGDVANAGLVEGVIKATVDENWATDETKNF